MIRYLPSGWSDWMQQLYIRTSLNNAYIILLPKIQTPKEAKDYRPITLVHSFAKLISKLLANRLAPHLHALVGRNQRRLHQAQINPRQLQICAEGGRLAQKEEDSQDPTQVGHLQGIWHNRLAFLVGGSKGKRIQQKVVWVDINPPLHCVVQGVA